MRRFLLFTFALTFLIPLLSSFCVQSSQSAELKDVQNLLVFYPVEKIRSDYIIVLDRSGSVRKQWPIVRDNVLTFISAIPNEDYVTILGFDERCAYIGLPTTLTNNTRATLTQNVRELGEPKGSYTDLFRKEISFEIGTPI